MPDLVDLEIGIHQRDAHRYRLELRLHQPEDDADVRPLGDQEVTFTLDEAAGLALQNDADAYGRWLGEQVFGDPIVQAALQTAQAAAAAAGHDGLRLRLFLGPSATGLHGLRWETVRVPGSGMLLTTDENILFSRYLSSSDWHPVGARPRSGLSALIVIANPRNLDDFSPNGVQLTPVDVSGERARANAALGDMPGQQLSEPGRATLNGLVGALREGCDILYLAAHGALVKGEPVLYLEDSEGVVDVIRGAELVERIRELRRRPRLVVLISCQSGGSGSAQALDGGALSALGPRLAAAGIPAVVAMQGNVTMETMAAFMPRFFAELQEDGGIDRAMAVARGVVRDRPDWWMPVLYMRLRSGLLWYTPGFGEDSAALRKWPALVANIREGKATPIVGTGLLESLFGSMSELARRWSETYSFPMASYEREDLTQVAQYLAVNQDWFFPRRELSRHLSAELRNRFSIAASSDTEATLIDLISTVGRAQRATNPQNPYRILAELGLPVYITTDPTPLLAEALESAGRKPVTEICPWEKEMLSASIFDEDPDYRPSSERPLIYHLFGHLSEPDSLVITEDDYFDYLISITREKDRIPTFIRRHLSDTSLLFLGFPLADWSFRIVYRSVMRQEGSRRRNRHTHVAAQISPEEGRILDPERARRHLETYFDEASIAIFWGEPNDFLEALQEKMGGQP